MTDLAGLTDALASLARLVPGRVRLVAIGWATVDLDRTVDDLAPRSSPGPVPPAAIVDEMALGARARVLGGDPVRLVVMEPATEGRLAAALARRGEGIACLYVTAERDGPMPGARPTALGRPGRLLPHDRPWGPFMILVEDDAPG